MGAHMEIKGSLEKKLEEARMRLALEKALKQAMYDLMRGSIKEAPPNTDYRKDKTKPRRATGNLARSFSIETRVNSTTIEGLLKNSTKYWQYVQFGTSRMNANDFVTRALEKVAPAEKCSKYFHKYYKES